MDEEIKEAIAIINSKDIPQEKKDELIFYLGFMKGVEIIQIGVDLIAKYSDRHRNKDEIAMLYKILKIFNVE